MSTGREPAPLGRTLTARHSRMAHPSAAGFPALRASEIVYPRAKSPMSPAQELKPDEMRAVAGYYGAAVVQ
jgi:hypothetical protein